MRARDGLVVESLRKDWPGKTITVSFEVPRGGSLAVLGPSGCGKSSVLRMIAGLLEPDAGRVTLEGRDITLLPPGKRRVGMVFQDSALFSHLSVADNIAYGLACKGVRARERRAAAERWLELMGLEGFGSRRVETLSGGEKQRVALARTLAVEPGLVLFDEPLSALDSDLRVRLGGELRARQLEFAFTALYVTHDEAEAARLADRVIRMP